jgi:hypothetical protein
MRYTLLFLLGTVASVTLNAQKVPRRVVVEHFTNSYCSVCANRNPGFYQNLSGFPQVLHVAIYPSAPYALCPFSQYNKPEQDARTSYYGVYGSTPKLVIAGTALPASASYNDQAIFTKELDSLSSFDAAITIHAINATTGEARLTIYKKDISSLDSLWLYAVLAQDTLNFTANNGETHHYDVFKKSIWGTDAVKVAVPETIGDSMSYTNTFSIDPLWPKKLIRATVMLQRDDKRIEQAARSKALELTGIPTGISVSGATNKIGCFPQPAGDRLYFTQSVHGRVSVFDLQGRIIFQQNVKDVKDINVSALVSGCYVIRLQTSMEIINLPFVKN